MADVKKLITLDALSRYHSKVIGKLKEIIDSFKDVGYMSDPVDPETDESFLSIINKKADKSEVVALEQEVGKVKDSMPKVVNIFDYIPKNNFEHDSDTESSPLMPIDADLYIYKEFDVTVQGHSAVIPSEEGDGAEFVFCVFHKNGKGDLYEVFSLFEEGEEGWKFKNEYSSESVPEYILKHLGELSQGNEVNICQYINLFDGGTHAPLMPADCNYYADFGVGFRLPFHQGWHIEYDVETGDGDIMYMVFCMSLPPELMSHVGGHGCFFVVFKLESNGEDVGWRQHSYYFENKEYNMGKEIPSWVLEAVGENVAYEFPKYKSISNLLSNSLVEYEKNTFTARAVEQFRGSKYRSEWYPVTAISRVYITRTKYDTVQYIYTKIGDTIKSVECHGVDGTSEGKFYYEPYTDMEIALEFNRSSETAQVDIFSPVVKGLATKQEVAELGSEVGQVKENQTTVNEIKAVMQTLPDGSAVSAQVAINTAKVGELENRMSEKKENIAPLAGEYHTEGFISANGDIAPLTSFYVRYYSCKDVLRFRIKGTGGGSARRYAFYNSADFSHTTLVGEVGPQITGDDFDEYIEIPSGAVYFAVTYRKTWEQSVFNVISEDINIQQEFHAVKEKLGGIEERISNNKTHTLKILFMGNSFTLNCISYVPLIIKKLLPDCDLTIGITFSSGATIGNTYAGVNNYHDMIENNQSVAYFKYVNGSNMWVSSNKLINDILVDEEWDCITLQQGSNNAPDYSTYQPYLNQCYDMIQSRINHCVKFGFIIVHADRNVLSSNKESDILSCGQRVYNETLCEFVVPYGTAIANARKTSIGNIGDGGNLLYEGKHLQEGLPMIVASLSVSLKVIELMGVFRLSMNGIDLTEINDSILELWNMPNHVALGNCIGVTKDNISVAVKSAIMAHKLPFSIFVE